MANDQDQSQKTEQPTEKKLQDAHKKGQVAKSQEVSTWFVLAAGTMFIAFWGPTMMTDLMGLLSQFIAKPHDLTTEPGGLPRLMNDLGRDVVVMIAMPFGVFCIAAVIGNLVQHRPVFTIERMKPKLDKISPLKGFKRLFGTAALVNFAKGLAKLTLIGAVAFLVVWPEHEQLADIVMRDIGSFFPLLQTLSLQMLGGVMAVLSVIAGLDFAYQKYDFMKNQRMTKQEVKDEHKQTEGDPHVKGKLRQIRMERGRQRMMANVPDATVVITNPTHFAVALKYETGETGAPVCVAKGADNIAFRIREIAKEHDVPIVENPPLARALFATVEIEDEIPHDHYQAVAEVISYVMRLKNKFTQSRSI